MEDQQPVDLDYLNNFIDDNFWKILDADDGDGIGEKVVAEITFPHSPLPLPSPIPHVEKNDPIGERKKVSSIIFYPIPDHLPSPSGLCCRPPTESGDHCRDFPTILSEKIKEIFSRGDLTNEVKEKLCILGNLFHYRHFPEDPLIKYRTLLKRKLVDGLFRVNGNVVEKCTLYMPATNNILSPNMILSMYSRYHEILSILYDFYFGKSPIGRPEGDVGNIIIIDGDEKEKTLMDCDESDLLTLTSSSLSSPICGTYKLMKGTSVLSFMKTYLNATDYYHETFTAYYCTNRLKTIIPNYQYLYSNFFFDDHSKKLIPEICEVFTRKKDHDHHWSYFLEKKQGLDRGQVPCTIVEQHTNMIPFSDFNLSEMGERDFVCCLFQIINALWIAGNKYSFVHGNLRSSNIYILRTDNNISIPYYAGQPDIEPIEYENTQFVRSYIESNYLVMITNYTRSQFYKEGYSCLDGGSSSSPKKILTYDLNFFLRDLLESNTKITGIHKKIVDKFLLFPVGIDKIEPTLYLSSIMKMSDDFLFYCPSPLSYLYRKNEERNNLEEDRFLLDIMIDSSFHSSTRGRIVIKTIIEKKQCSFTTKTEDEKIFKEYLEGFYSASIQVRTHMKKEIMALESLKRTLIDLEQKFMKDISNDRVDRTIGKQIDRLFGRIEFLVHSNKTVKDGFIPKYMTLPGLIPSKCLEESSKVHQELEIVKKEFILQDIIFRDCLYIIVKCMKASYKSPWWNFRHYLSYIVLPPTTAMTTKTIKKKLLLPPPPSSTPSRITGKKRPYSSSSSHCSCCSCSSSSSSSSSNEMTTIVQTHNDDGGGDVISKKQRIKS